MHLRPRSLRALDDIVSRLARVAPSPRWSRAWSKRTLASFWAGCGFFLGCGVEERAIESTTLYELPLEHRVVVETVVDLPFDAAWDELIRRLSESSFRVATLEKASRFVVVELDRSSDLALSADQPGRYIDCGRTVRTFAWDGDLERFDYAVAESSRHRESDPVEGGFRVSDVARRVELDGRASLYLQPEGARRTRVTVNARYKVEFEVSGTARFVPLETDEPEGGVERFGPRVESIRFTTFQPGRDQRGGGLTCRATGHFEHALIAMANPAAAI